MKIDNLQKIIESLSVKSEPYHIRAALLCMVEYLKERESMITGDEATEEERNDRPRAI
jgi:hypothetical protein